MYAAWKGVPIDVRRGVVAFMENDTQRAKDNTNSPNPLRVLKVGGNCICPWGALLHIYGADSWELLPAQPSTVYLRLRAAMRRGFIIPWAENLDWAGIKYFMDSYDAGRIKDLRRALGV